MSGFNISERIKDILPDARLGILECQVNVRDSPLLLLEEIEKAISKVKSQLNIEKVSQVEIIGETKTAYRKLGKDPSRYRPSAEALVRRILKGQGLYRVNNIVDLLNLVSVKSGFSIGGYDAIKVKGDITLDTGNENELYSAIGRGELNIHQLPVLRDEKGAFGSPTSDSERTMVVNGTTNFLMVFFDFFSNDQLQTGIGLAESLLTSYGFVDKINSYTFP